MKPVFNKSRGFTLMEIMIVFLIVAVLSAIAVPIYRDYAIQAKITPVISGLAVRQTQMEQCYQDNHTYVGCDTIVCRDPPETEGDFTFSCGNPTGTAFTLTATGQNSMTGFEYTVNQSNVRTSKIEGGPSGWDAEQGNCWITGKGGTC
jgi:type IV pilus assembly protein PilE